MLQGRVQRIAYDVESQTASNQRRPGDSTAGGVVEEKRIREDTASSVTSQSCKVAVEWSNDMPDWRLSAPQTYRRLNSLSVLKRATGWPQRQRISSGTGPAWQACARDMRGALVGGSRTGIYASKLPMAWRASRNKHQDRHRMYASGCLASIQPFSGGPRPGKPPATIDRLVYPPRQA